MGSELVKAGEADRASASQGGMDEELEKLTKGQRALVTGLIEGKQLSELWRRAGYASEAAARVDVNGNLPANALKKWRKMVIMGEAATTAVVTMMDLARPGTAPTVRLAAAKWLAEAAGHGRQDDDRGDKALSEMTASELQAFIDRQNQIIELGDKAKAVAGVQIDG